MTLHAHFDRHQPISDALSPGEARPDPRWVDARERFLAAIDAAQRPAVTMLLEDPRNGGPGLRMWLRALSDQEKVLPVNIPRQIIEVYLADPEALPLHDCADCGLAIPVQRGPRGSWDETPQRVYFERCPQCGGPTGLYAYWSRETPRKPERRCSGPASAELG